LLLFRVVQDVAHAGDRTCVLRPRQRPGPCQLIAGFQVSINCRFWVSTEAAGHHFLLNVLPLRCPESLQKLRTYVETVRRIDPSPPDPDAVLLRCRSLRILPTSTAPLGWHSDT
jgi:hypothetical protein